MKWGESDMTNGELYNYVRKQMEGFSEEQIDDWRPASGFYIDDIVKTDAGGSMVPYGIRLWLTNGGFGHLRFRRRRRWKARSSGKFARADKESGCSVKERSDRHMQKRDIKGQEACMPIQERYRYATHFGR